MKKNILVITAMGTLGLLIFCMVPCQTARTYMNRDEQGYVFANTLDRVISVYPKTAAEIVERSHAAQKKVLELVKEISSCPVEKQNKITMLQAFDRALNYLDTEARVFGLVKEVYGNEQIRDIAEKEEIALENFGTEHVDGNAAVYKAFKMYAQNGALKEALSREDIYFLHKILESFNRAGLDLSEEKQAHILQLKKECTELSELFLRNIVHDETIITVAKDDLKGIPADFIKALSIQDDKYVLRMDYPTRTMMLSRCQVEATRKAYYVAFYNRAYPKNEQVLKDLIAKRHEFARLLGYESYAHYNLADQMIKTPERAWAFERELQPKALKKANLEVAALVKDLPVGVTLTQEGKIKPWDMGYISTYYKKKYYNLDEQLFAEYFPMEHTVAGLINVYEKFFNLVIETVPAEGMWHPDVKLLKISNKDDHKVRGYVFLDMFPRDKKHGGASSFCAIPALAVGDTIYPAVVTLVCNFTKPVADKPSLLQYKEVRTFFHEFGHAIHSLLGATYYADQSGTSVETDFVELPSQMLENWMEDAEILKLISHHYKTGEPLSDDLIEKRVELLNYDRGNALANELALGMVSLSCFGADQTKTPGALVEEFYKQNCPYALYPSDSHMYCSLNHLIGYGACVYGYAWSRALSTDVFETIKKEGLLNPASGKKYVDAILSQGGSKDANDMMRDYLGREPKMEPFFHKMGFDQ